MLGEILRIFCACNRNFLNKSIYLHIQYLSKIMINLVYNENKHNRDIFFKRSYKDVSVRSIWPFHWLLLLTRKNKILYNSSWFTATLKSFSFLILKYYLLMPLQRYLSIKMRRISIYVFNTSIRISLTNMRLILT